MPTETLDISGGDVASRDLEALSERAKSVLGSIRSGEIETRLPIGFEFSGSPKAGKSSVIGLVSLFARRAGFRVSAPPEGASIETPPDLKDDLLAFNAWCGCYAIQNILIRSHEGDPYDMLLLDRGLFDWVVWLEFLHTKERSIDQSLCNTMASFALAAPWLEREQALFLFTADSQTSLERERSSQLTMKPGRAMNPQFLDDLRTCYDSILARQADRLPTVFRIDTSRVRGVAPSFQRVAYVVADKMLSIVEESTSQVLMVIPPIFEKGVVDAPDVLNRVRAMAIGSPKFIPRTEAELSTRYQQIVPYGVLRNNEGKYLCAKRRTDERPQLAGKTTMLFGGHAEARDWNSGTPDGVFERCLRRELGEELIGVTVNSARLFALVNDRSSEMGKRHLAFVHEVEVGGRVAIRRQTADREFGRDGPEWKSREEIIEQMAKLDPWSQLVAAKIFNVSPSIDAQSLLFENE